MSTREPKLRPKVGVGVMLFYQNHILLGKRLGAHAEGYYGWTGGHLEWEETLEDCGKREVFEETGIIIESLELLCMNNILDYGQHYLDIEFISILQSKEQAKVKEPDRVESWSWYPIDKLPSPLFRPVELALYAFKNGSFYKDIESPYNS